jgi:hypothetical protein
LSKLTLTIFAPASYADNICKPQIDGLKFSFRERSSNIPNLKQNARKQIMLENQIFKIHHYEKKNGGQQNEHYNKPIFLKTNSTKKIEG